MVNVPKHIDRRSIAALALWVSIGAVTLALVPRIGAWEVYNHTGTDGGTALWLDVPKAFAGAWLIALPLGLLAWGRRSLPPKVGLATAGVLALGLAWVLSAEYATSVSSGDSGVGRASANPAKIEHPTVLVADDYATAHMLALAEGPLTDAHGCLGIADSPVVWPKGTRFDTQDGTFRLTYEGKTYRLGDKIQLGGGFDSVGMASGLVKSVPRSCKSAQSFWIV